MNGLSRWVVAVLAVAAVVAAQASVVGRNTPAESLTRERVMRLPAAERAAWMEYLRRSEAQMAADKAALAAERLGLKEIPGLPRQGFSARSIPVHREAEFYASDEAKHIGDVILSFQTPGGGWSKNLDMSGVPRQRGQLYATANLAPVEGNADDFDKPHDPAWHYISTLDNDATNTELHFLAELSAALPGKEGDRYRAAALRGFEYLLQAQYPNGGWPQVWPLEGGYHDAITFNDDAVTESAEVLTRVAAAARVTDAPSQDELEFARLKASPGGPTVGLVQAAVEDYSFVPAAMRMRAQAAVARALDCILKTQLRVPAEDGKAMVLAVWAQQNDPLTLQPVSARNYEMPALSSGESASVVEYLMSLPHPSAAVVRAVDAAAAWFQAHAMEGYAWSGGRNVPGGRTLRPAMEAAPLWARYYSLTTGKPIFGDRDKTIHDDVMELSLERRNGYAWYNSDGKRVLQEYAQWKKARQRGN
jgi:hypothetical protein